jgi:tetratricopeptide (TPR) repeat protein
MRRWCIGGVAVLAAATAVPAPAQLHAGDRSHFNACRALVRSDPARAVANAQAWRIEGGGVPARLCLALAQFALGDTDTALKSFEAAAAASESSRDGEAVAILSQAAEAALIAQKPQAAVDYLGRALAGAGGITLSPRAEAALRVTRAEALVDVQRNADAAADLAAATSLYPAVPNGWLLKATLARRMGDLKTAETAIVAAGERASGDPAVQYEAGNIAAAKGETALAQKAWAAAAAVDPDSVPGRAAQAALDAASAPAPPQSR